MAALLRSEGCTVFVENIFENRYRHVDELSRMGAEIRVVGRVAVVNGVRTLHGAAVKCTDLRGGAALVIAGLSAEGTTRVTELTHIDRGYDAIEVTWPRSAHRSAGRLHRNEKDTKAMARNRSTNRRRRRGRFSFLMKLLCILLIAGAVVAALTVFFKVQSITVSGNARYTSEEVVAASGIEIEDNLFLLNKYSAAQAIFEKLPYVEEATINRALPDTIVITVRECVAAAGVVTPEGYWLISENGKLLERTDTLPSGCPGITGVEPESPALSAQLSLGEEKTLTTETLLTLVRTAGGYGMLAGIGSVDLSDAEAITFTYLGRFTVRLPWDSDLDYIFRSVQDLVNGLESNETGEINYMLLKSKGEMRFIPSAPGA